MPLVAHIAAARHPYRKFFILLALGDQPFELLVPGRKYVYFQGLPNLFTSISFLSAVTMSLLLLIRFLCGKPPAIEDEIRG
jgi:hypothetical protein